MGQDAEWSDSKQGQTLALRAYLHIYVLTCTKYTPNLTLLPLPKSVSLSGGGGGGPSIKTFEFSRDISYSIHSRNHITIQPKMCGQVVRREKAIPSLWTFTSDLPPWQKL